MRKHIVTLGGGHGSSTLLRGLAPYDVDITAVVTPFDSGGSSGALRQEYGGIAVGDLRLALTALAPEREPYATLRDLAQHRFDKDTRFGGHTIGNLMLVGLEKTSPSHEEFLERAGRMFGLPAGRHAMPSSFDSSQMQAAFADGCLVTKEAEIEETRQKGRCGDIRRLSLTPGARAYEGALEAVQRADLIAIGPGSFYESVVANLLVDGIPEAIRNSGATTIYICNAVANGTENGTDHVRQLAHFMGSAPEYAIASNGPGREPFPPGFRPLKIDRKAVEELGTKPIFADLAGQRPDRHDAQKLAGAVMGLV